jgi:hypothetical protein
LSASGFNDCVTHKLSRGEKAAQNSTDGRVWQTQSGADNLVCEIDEADRIVCVTTDYATASSVGPTSSAYRAS